MMTTQLDHVKKILFFNEMYPDLEIKICVSSDEVTDCNWTAHQISRVEVLPWYEAGEYFYVDEEEIKGRLDEECDSELSDIEVNHIVQERYEREVKHAICVFTCA